MFKKYLATSLLSIATLIMLVLRGLVPTKVSLEKSISNKNMLAELFTIRK